MTRNVPSGGDIAILIVSALIIIAAGIWTFLNVKDGNDQEAAAAQEAIPVGFSAYHEAEEQTASEVYLQYYKASAQNAEHAYHVSSYEEISIERLEELNDLDVLEVSQTEVVIEDSANNDSGTFCWLSVTGSAVYQVNMDMAEILADDARGAVTVRIPAPQLAYRGLDEVEELATHTQYTFFNNGSIAEGTAIADELIKEGDRKVYEALCADQDSPERAKASAQALIRSLVKEANPDIPDLAVEVEVMS